jgi:hypothetical protein
MHYFLIIGNGRTGSTWLETSFDQLPDVIARREIKWRLPYQAEHPMHRYIGMDTRSIKDVLLPPDDGEKSVKVIGSKLIFDPYGYISSAVFDRINHIVDKDVRLIHLRRSYVEIFRSWKLRGVAHRVNERVLPSGKVDPMLVHSVSRLGPESREVQRIRLTVGGVPMTDAAEADASTRCIHYALEDAIDDLLVYFHNDVVAYSKVLSRPGSVGIEYGEIHRRFPALSRFVGSAASESEISSVLELPAVTRLEPLDGALVEPRGVLERFSECLESAFREVVRNSARENRPWVLHEEDGAAAITIPRFEALLTEHGVGRPLERRSRLRHLRFWPNAPVRPVRWQLRKPVYRQ